MSEQKTSKHSIEEERVLSFWKEHDIFKRSISERSEGNPYVFYDGPPFATGLPHYGHLVASTMKDVVPRYFTMRGFRVERTWGWDCHGLPIEAIVEKKHGLKNRQEIEEMGVAAFNESCDAEIMTYAEDWKQVIHRLGRWVNMDEPYMTKDLQFMESVWWAFSELYKKGHIYEGYKVMHVSPALETVLSNMEVSDNYSDLTDISAYASFTLTSGEYEGVKMIAWTTTPWTLPGNALLAVGNTIEYTLVVFEDAKYIVAKELLEEAFEGKEYQVKSELKGSDLVGASYEPLFPYFADHKNAFRVVHADFVTTDDGTGIVHIAPGFGEDDLELGKKEGVEPIMHVQMDGRFIPEVEQSLVEEGYDVKDWPVKKKDDNMHVDIEIIKWLAHKGKLFAKKKIKHNYPLCWRTDCALINYATTSWFVKVEDIRDTLVRTNKEIRWVPEHIKEGRFGKGLAQSPDWSISRSRYWGTPMPLWRSEDGDIIVVGSVDELEELTGTRVDNLHKHIVDELTIEKDGKTYTRIPEVLDCWFESGSMPYGQMHYPFENKEKFDRGFPAEFIAEGQDQTRAWFHKLHVLSNILFGMPAFKNVIVNGIVLAEDGKKMSKRLQNYPDPTEVMNTYGADAVRYYLMTSSVVHAENLRFKESDVDEVAKKFIAILRNVVSFYALYKEHDDGREASGEHVLDKWILARLNQALATETEAMDNYDLQAASRPLQHFVTDLSTWYVRRSRDRVKTDGEDQKEALATLRTVLDTFSKMIAPFMPFLAEMVYQEIDGSYDSEERPSVHLEMWPEAQEVDETILEQMGEARALVSRILDAREETGLPVKQVLGSVQVTTPAGSVRPEIQEVILNEVNIKEMHVEEGELSAKPDFTLTPELKREGMLRELSRKINGMRKDAGLTIDDRITVNVWSESTEVNTMLDEHEGALKDAVLAHEIVRAKPDVDGVQVRIMEQEIELGICD